MKSSMEKKNEPIEIAVTTIVEYPLREKMAEKGMSIRQLAQASGVDYTYISRLLSGKSQASPNVFDRLRTALGDAHTPTTQNNWDL